MTCAIEADKLSVTYRGSSRPALADVSVVARAGTRICITGADGAGKSTFCLCLNGVIPHIYRTDYSGRVLVHGRDPKTTPVHEMAALSGLVLQDFDAGLLTHSVEQELAFGLENLRVPRQEGLKRIEFYLDILGLQKRRFDPPATLSGGQRQLLATAALLIMQLPVMIFDEATSDLDPTMQARLRELIGRLRPQGSTELFVDQRTENALTADEIWVFENGSILRSGKPEDILLDDDLLGRACMRPPELPELMHRLGFPKKLYRPAEALREIRTFAPSLLTFKSEPAADAGQFRSPFMEMIALGYSYTGHEAKALSDITLSIGRGESVAILGCNGSGKSTLAKVLSGIYAPSKGTVSIDGRPIQHYKRHELAQLVGYVYQNPDQQIFAATVSEEVSFGPRQLGFSRTECRSMVSDALTMLGLQGIDQRDPMLLTKGERHRVCIASVLVTKPQMLILDEPTKGLDYCHQLKLLDLLKRLNDIGHTIVIITHSIWVAAEYCSRVIVMRDGVIAGDGSTQQVLAHPSILEGAGLRSTDLIGFSNLLGLGVVRMSEIESELRMRMAARKA
jgi:energy-coupling factor transporter ATP-binding protein EcfA2